MEYTLNTFGTKEEFQDSFNQLVDDRLIELGISLGDLAKVAKIEYKYLHKIKTNKRGIGLEVMLKVFAALRLEIVVKSTL